MSATGSAAHPRGPGRGAPAHGEKRTLRIGEVAEQAGVTPRTIRYWEEMGLLTGAEGRPSGGHRAYGPGDVDQVREIVRLKELLGLSLEQLRTLLEAESARAELRREWGASASDGRRAEILDEAMGHLTTQLELVRDRRRELEALEAELGLRRRRLRERRRDLGVTV